MKLKHLLLSCLLPLAPIAQVPVINTFNGPVSRCSAPTASLGYVVVASNSPTSYNWSVTPNAPITFNSPQNIYIDFPIAATNPTHYTITCTASNASGTSAPNTKIVSVYNTQMATVIGSQVICKGESTTLTLSTIPYYPANYSWLPSTFLNSSSSQIVTASPTITTAYSVYINDFQCPWTTTLTIEVNDCTNLAEENQSHDPKLRAFPNPSNGKFEIYSDKTEDIQILNLQGKLIKTIHVTQNESVMVKDLHSGIYILKSQNSLIRLICLESN